MGEGYVLVPCQPHQKKGNIGQYEKERYTVYGQEAEFLQPKYPVEIKGEIGYNDKSGGIDDDVLEVEGHIIAGIGQQPVSDIEPDQHDQQDDISQPCPVMGSLEIERKLCAKDHKFDDDCRQCDGMHLCTAYSHSIKYCVLRLPCPAPNVVCYSDLHRRGDCPLFKRNWNAIERDRQAHAYAGLHYLSRSIYKNFQFSYMESVCTLNSSYRNCYSVSSSNLIRYHFLIGREKLKVKK